MKIFLIVVFVIGLVFILVVSLVTNHEIKALEKEIKNDYQDNIWDEFIKHYDEFTFLKSSSNGWGEFLWKGRYVIILVNRIKFDKTEEISKNKIPLYTFVEAYNDNRNIALCSYNTKKSVKLAYLLINKWRTELIENNVI
jgi:hypothetical protein